MPAHVSKAKMQSGEVDVTFTGWAGNGCADAAAKEGASLQSGLGTARLQTKRVAKAVAVAARWIGRLGVHMKGLQGRDAQENAFPSQKPRGRPPQAPRPQGACLVAGPPTASSSRASSAPMSQAPREHVGRGPHTGDGGRELGPPQHRVAP